MSLPAWMERQIAIVQKTTAGWSIVKREAADMSDPQLQQSMEARVMDDTLAKAKSVYLAEGYASFSAGRYIELLEARIAELERDGGRVDWCERIGASISHDVIPATGAKRWWVSYPKQTQDYCFEGSTLRGAIDAAIKAEEKGK